MGANPMPLDPPPRAVRRRVLAGVPACLAAVACTVAAAGYARAPRPTYPVLDTRTTTTITSTASGGVERGAGESWTVPALGLVREAPTSPAGPPNYDVRGRSGAWSRVAYVGAGAAGGWRRAPIPAGQAPALLSERAVDALFLRLRADAGAGGMSRVALDGRMADTFTTRALAWPYRYAGLARVWMDDATGRPRQIRVRAVLGNAVVTILTTIDSMRTIPSTSLPDDFFTPPDQRPSPWERAMRWLSK